MWYNLSNGLIKTRKVQIQSSDIIVHFTKLRFESVIISQAIKSLKSEMSNSCVNTRGKKTKFEMTLRQLPLSPSRVSTSATWFSRNCSHWRCTSKSRFFHSHHFHYYMLKNLDHFTMSYFCLLIVKRSRILVLVN